MTQGTGHDIELRAQVRMGSGFRLGVELRLPGQGVTALAAVAQATRCRKITSGGGGPGSGVRSGLLKGIT